MQSHSIHALTLAAFALAAGCTGGTLAAYPDDSSGPRVHQGVEAAHEAYLAGEWKRLVSAVRDVLADDGASGVERRNVLDLLESAYERTEGQLPTDWRMPASMPRMAIEQNHNREPGAAHFRLKAKVRMLERDLVTRLVLARGDGEVVLDSAAAGHDTEVEAEDDGTWTFVVEQPERDQPEPEGVYWITVQRRDGDPVEGWVIFSRHVSSATPTLLDPTPEEHVSTGTPRVAWEPFRSPEYHPYERRTMVAYVGTWKPDRDPKWITTWGMWSPDPSLTELRIGDPELGAGARELDPGTYWMGVAFREERTMGPVRLRRVSRVSRPLVVE